MMSRIDKDIKSTAGNTLMLYIMAAAKLILPLLTMPYLTRVLSEESYGIFTYVRACMIYIQLIIDFGFMLSAVKDIVNTGDDRERIGYVCGHTYLAKTILIVVATLLMVLMCIFIPILRKNLIYSLLCFVAVALTAYLADFVFIGIERMRVITVIFLAARSVSVSLTFVLIKSDSDILLIPILDIAANVISVILGFYQTRREGIRIRICSIKAALLMLKESFFYFISNMATTAFSALSTLVIGLVITDLKEIAHWGVCIQIISAIQGLYSPITSGIYPHMIKKKSLAFIHKVLFIIMPIVLIGCIVSFVLSRTALLLVGGEDYVEAYRLLRCLIPILFFSFPAQLYGWTTLGAVGLVKETTASTVIAASIQVIGLVVLLIMEAMTLYSIAILKVAVEISLLAIRMFFTYKNKDKFALL